ncbi:YsnF/AvaK domain-containing protein [Ectobacillus funiculus]|uniref:YsnF/AvaK domain-containing protein n=1 Tax=Ectobacillus funiculus TaxID=137993 RepID=UPI00101D1627|nr:YsnF/AvaK domain-containing protein [Ectobacillus funiculus]
MSKQSIDSDNQVQKLQLHEEQLDISKTWIQTGEITVRREVVTEIKRIEVPVVREELVIEKKILDAKSLDQQAEHTETIRIPISEERIEITKQPTALEDISIYKNTFEEIVQIDETLKKEILDVNTTGSPIIIERQADV